MALGEGAPVGSHSLRWLTSRPVSTCNRFIADFDSRRANTNVPLPWLLFVIAPSCSVLSDFPSHVRWQAASRPLMGLLGDGRVLPASWLYWDDNRAAAERRVSPAGWLPGHAVLVSP